MKRIFNSAKYYMVALVISSMLLLSSCQAETALGMGLLAWQLGLFDKGGSGNRPPQILTLTAVPSTVPAGGNAVLTVVAVDPDEGDTLTYKWTTSYGVLHSPDEAITQWTAPTNYTGVVTINVTVSDSKESVTGSLPVSVTLN